MILFSLIRAIVLGALLVVFLPFAGFVVVLVALAEKCRGLLKESPPTVVE